MSDAAVDETPLPERRNRPVTIAHRLEYALARMLVGFFRIVGIDAASAIASAFTRSVGPLLAISKRADDNLKAVYPEMTAGERRRIVAGVWDNLGRTAAEMAHLDKFRPGEAGGRVEVIGDERLRRTIEAGRPAIFVSGHFANWEIMPITIHRAGIRLASVYRAANNPLIDEFIIKARALVMGRCQIPKGKRGGRALIEALKDGRSLGMLVDQKLNDGISAPFLGREAMTAPAAARLALKYGAPIYPGWVERLGGAHFRMTIDSPIQFAPSGDATADVRELTILINRRIETYVRARPDQWLWLHRRWPKASA
ncbi:MAG: lauroyl acyltransferase [Parvularculaceae bacterium]